MNGVIEMLESVLVRQRYRSPNTCLDEDVPKFMKLFDAFTKVFQCRCHNGVAAGNVAGIHECRYAPNHSGWYIPSYSSKKYLQISVSPKQEQEI